jgi:hypothetical protein
VTSRYCLAGFEGLAEQVGTPSKSLMRMFGPNGDPRAGNLFSVISLLQELTGVRLAVRQRTG